MTANTQDSANLASTNYRQLRADAMRRLERLASDSWTDHNVHDPGITILEQLCYAITDLGYRIDYGIADLLASDPSGGPASLFTPAELLTTRPVTLLDLRKVVIDVPGVRNAWIEPLADPEPRVLFDPAEKRLYFGGKEEEPHQQPTPIRGIYRVDVDILDEEQASTRWEQEIRPAIWRRLSGCRNLCEDFDLAQRRLAIQPIQVDAEIEVDELANPEQLFAEIRHALGEHIAPNIQFYSLAEMIDRGLSVDQIFDGPRLNHGFIDSDELESFHRRTALRSSDLIRVVMALDGVRSVRHLAPSEATGNQPAANSVAQDWYLKLAADKTPRLSAESRIALTRNGARLPINAARVSELMAAKQLANQRRHLPASQRDLPPPAGRHRNVEDHHSILHQFPAVYGVGEGGLPASASDQRQAQARQLKAYLMFFDQLLANSFSQLAHTAQLFSFHDASERSYFSNMLNEPTLELEALRRQEPTAHQATLERLSESSGDETENCAPGERKNRFLNHLLARFGERVNDHQLQGDTLPSKSNLLREYDKIGYSRGGAFDYTRESWGTENVSGLEMRLSRLLGMSSYQRRSLVELRDDELGGFHMIEHILLRPRPADLAQWTDTPRQPLGETFALMANPVSPDPFSTQVSFVFPAWLQRFQQDADRRDVARLLREETPAHLGIHLHWLDVQAMRDFERAYRQLLDNLVEEH